MVVGKESFCLWDRGIMDFWEATFIICKTVHRKQWGLGKELPVNESFVSSCLFIFLNF